VTDPLALLAARTGVETAYHDVRGRLRTATPEVLVRTLRALGLPLERPSDAAALLEDSRSDAPAIEPVLVAWGGALPGFVAQRPAWIERAVEVSITLESGAAAATSARVAPGAAGTAWVPFPLPLPLPSGLHRLAVEAPGERAECLVIAAPRRAAAPQRGWGVFMPLYAFGPADDVADYGDLAAAARWAGSLGAACVATLPLLAAYLDEPFDPSPYAPASRLFWNELFVDTDAVPGGCATPALAQAPDRPGLLDYRTVAARRRARLGPLAHRFFDAGGHADKRLSAWVEREPLALDYARFRAAGDRLRAPWKDWPARLRDGGLRDDDVDPRDVQYHLFAAWQADEQLAAIARAANDGAAALYLDLPLGVHDAGYDAWRERGLFAAGVAAGAPPDALFAGGQNWGFRPMCPAAMRRTGHRYFIATLRHHLRHAGILRIDHVMALRRLFWVPDGFPPTEGVYVRYPQEELFAILALESSRHGTPVIGEDLGTVPDEVRSAMREHGLLRMFVLQFALEPAAEPPLPAVPPGCSASLNTHDMPPFAAFWHGLDIADQLELGVMEPETARAEAARRAAIREHLAHRLGLPRDAAGRPDTDAALQALLEHLARSDADTVLVALEDLWLETLPQNVPGTGAERPNWRRRARRSIHDVMRDPGIAARLAAIDRTRTESDAHA
jgi:4-alpha-glucanotransferase